jgi:hypothetical protein
MLINCFKVFLSFKTSGSTETLIVFNLSVFKYSLILKSPFFILRNSKEAKFVSLILDFNNGSDEFLEETMMIE